uniref:Putative hydrolase enzyme n=1 Tax=viral metagenome TaxID=1070528 RepID=A0A6M3ISL0_9ZZZZ
MPDVLLVIDMQRAFLEKGYPLYCGDGARKIIPNVQSLIESKLAEGVSVLFTQDTHRSRDQEFRMFPRHCIYRQKDWKIIPELFNENIPALCKTTFDPFFDAFPFEGYLDLNDYLDDLIPNTITVVGVCTDICVLYTVAGARVRGYDVVVPANCIASFNEDNHKWALNHMEKVLGAYII